MTKRHIYVIDDEDPIRRSTRLMLTVRGYEVATFESGTGFLEVARALRPGAVLVDLACGGGLLAPHVAPLGYRHVGIDLNEAGLRSAREHGVLPVRGSVFAVPLPDGCAYVVVAGEILEHVEDDVAVLAECARMLRSVEEELPQGKQELAFGEHFSVPV